MKKMILLSLLAIMAFGVQAQTENSAPYVEVRGNASRLVEPNRIEVRVSLNEAYSKGKIKLSTMESDLARALKLANINASKQLVVSAQSSSAQKKSGAYQFKNFLLTLTSVGEVNAVFDAFATCGVQNAQINRTYNIDQPKINRELQIEAMANSKETAETLAQAIGQTIGSAIQIQYWDSPIAINYVNDNMIRSKTPVMGSGDVPPSLPENLELQPINMQLSVTVRYALYSK